MRFRTKLALVITCLASLVFGVGGSLLTAMSFDASLEREKLAALASYRLATNTLMVVSEVDREQKSGVVSTLSRLSSASPAWSSMRLYNGENAVIYSYGRRIEPPAETEELEAGKCLVYVEPIAGDERRLVLVGAITAGGERMVLAADYDVSAIYTASAEQRRVYRVVFIFMAALCATLSYIAAWLLTRPLSSLSRASRRLAAGELSYRARVYSADEVGMLARDFNIMAKKIESNVGELRDAMERQERFMGSFAHEMKTPMTSVIGYADLIRSGALSPEEAGDAANYIFSEGKRLESLSLKLLEILVTKESGPALAPASPARLIGASCERLAPIYAKRGITLRYKCADGECMLDADLAGSLLYNLIDNAAKAIDGEGGIFVLSEMTAEGCKISVTDTGRGMTKETMEHITEAFYRADKARARAQGGAGLGLALCAEIVELHNGTLTFSSRMGQGTRVTAELKGGRV